MALSPVPSFISVFVGVAAFVVVLVFVFGLVVIALIALFVPLTASAFWRLLPLPLSLPFFLGIFSSLFLYALTYLFSRFLHVLLLDSLILTLPFLHIFFVSTGVGLNLPEFGFIDIFIPNFLPVDSKLLVLMMDLVDMSQIFLVADQMFFFFFLLLAGGILLLVEDWPLVVVSYLIVVVLVLPFVKFFVVVLVQFLVVVLTAHPLGHQNLHHFQFLLLLLGLSLILLLLFFPIKIFLVPLHIINILQIDRLSLSFLLDLLLPRFVLIEVFLLKLVVKGNDDFLDELHVETVLTFLIYLQLLYLLLTDSMNHTVQIEFLLDYLVHQHVMVLVFLYHCGPFAKITEYPVEGIYVGLGC